MTSKEHAELMEKLEDKQFLRDWQCGRRDYLLYPKLSAELAFRQHDFSYTQYKEAIFTNYLEGWNFERSNFVRERRRNSRIIQSTHY